MRSKLFKVFTIVLLISLLLISGLYAQTSSRPKKYGSVLFDYHNAKWSFEKIPSDSSQVLVYYNVFFNSMGVSKYELYESNEKSSICQVYYDSKGKIDKWEVFNGRKISQTAKFEYEDGKLVQINEYEHRGKIIHLAYKHYYNIIRTKLEVYDANNLRKVYNYWDSGQVHIEGTYNEGKKDGLWIYYNRLGNMEKKEEYYNDKLIARTSFEYGDLGEKTRTVLTDANGKIHKTVTYKYNPKISKKDPVEVRQYKGKETDGELISITIAEFDEKDNTFIGMIQYTPDCKKIISIKVFIITGAEGDGYWDIMKDPRNIKAYLNNFDLIISCQI